MTVEEQTIWLAAISGAAGLLGVIAGSVSTYWVQSLVGRAQREHEIRREDRSELLAGAAECVRLASTIYSELLRSSIEGVKSESVIPTPQELTNAVSYMRLLGNATVRTAADELFAHVSDATRDIGRVIDENPTTAERRAMNVEILGGSGLGARIRQFEATIRGGTDRLQTVSGSKGSPKR